MLAIIYRRKASKYRSWLQSLDKRINDFQTLMKASLFPPHSIPCFLNAKIRFYASDMNLQADSGAAYLVLPLAHSHYAGYFYLRSLKSTNGRLNGSILIICKSIWSVVASAAEAETGGLFYNSQDNTIIIRHSLEALGHPQPKTPIKTDNSTTIGFIYDYIRQRKSKTWDMMRWNWCWLHDK